MSDGGSGRGGGCDGFVLAIDIGGTKTDLATVAPDGTLLRRTTEATRASEGAARVVERAVRRGRELVAETAQELGAPLRAVGAVCPGIVRDEGVRLAPNIPGSATLALADSVRKGFVGTAGATSGSPPVAVGNDVRAGALAESRWGALAGAHCGIFLNLGTGLAASVVLDGRVLEGAHGAAGELGYQLRDRHDIPATGTPAAASAAGEPTPERAAPLEEFVSGRALAERGSRLLGRRADTTQVLEAAEFEPELRRLVDEAVDTLAVHTGNLAIALDPDLIAVGGGLLRAGHRILHRLAEVLDSAVPYPPQLCRARFTYDAPLHGAAILALDAWRPPEGADTGSLTEPLSEPFTGPGRR